MALSETFANALFRYRRGGGQMYRLAMSAGLSPSAFSAMLHGARQVSPGDARIVKIGAELGLSPDECFEADQQVAS